MSRVLLPICALAVALGLGASRQQPDGLDRQQVGAAIERRGDAPPSAPPEVRDAQPYNPPCEPGEDDRASDLCAQWKAADGAARGAAWAASVGVATWIGVFLGFGTLIAAGLAAKFAKEAADHTDNSAKAAWAAERLARESAERQLRAYLTVHTLVAAPPAVGLPYTVEIKVRNGGVTPASGVRHKVTIDLTDDDSTYTFADHQDAELPFQSRTTVGPGVDYIFNIRTPRPMTAADIALFAQNRRVVVWGIVEYEDVFGNSRESQFRYTSGPLMAGGFAFPNWPSGNEFT